MTNWISVKDRLPRPGDWVLTYTPDESLSKRHLSKPTWFIQIKFVFKNSNVNNKKSRFYGVTHWQPLPEVPKDE